MSKQLHLNDFTEDTNLRNVVLIRGRLTKDAISDQRGCFATLAHNEWNKATQKSTPHFFWAKFMQPVTLRKGEEIQVRGELVMVGEKAQIKVWEFYVVQRKKTEVAADQQVILDNEGNPITG